ncbi:PGG domain containing protein, partial [Parasponia andersonii]
PDCWNKDYLQPYASCMRDHKALVTAGKEWMRDKSQSCIIVGVLITTIMFAAAFLVPAGGNNQDTNIPVLVNRKLFELFNALSLFSSTISMLMFIGIHTSRFAREDFLKSLPTKMIIGLSTLFFSIATMIIAFSAILSTMFLQDSRIGSAIILLAGIPITLSFMMMDFPLLVDIVMSTYGPSIFNRKVKPWM